MAKLLSENDKTLILADFHTGKFSQRDLSKKYDVSLGAVNKIVKGIVPANEHIVEAQITILTAKDILSNEQMNAIVNIAKEEIFNRGLCTNAAQLAALRASELLSKNKKELVLKTKIGDTEVIEKIEAPLSADDIKLLSDAIDKASLTLKVNERHAKQVEIQNTNANQTNIEVVNPFKNLN